MANLRFVDSLNTQECIEREAKVAPELSGSLATRQAAVLIPVSPLVLLLSPVTPVRVTPPQFLREDGAVRDTLTDRQSNQAAGAEPGFCPERSVSDLGAVPQGALNLKWP